MKSEFRPLARVAFAVAFMPIALVAGADVPQFRGPGGSGVSDEKNLPVEWSEQNNIRWTADLPGIP